MSKLKTLEEQLFSRFQVIKPKSDVGGTFEVALSEDNILADIKYVLTTGIRPFDDIIGGFPFGRISEIYGLEACGKTALMVRCAIRAKLGHIYEVMSRQGTRYTLQRLDPATYEVTIVYVDNEQSLEDGYKIEIVNIEYDAKGNPIRERHRLKAFIVRCDTVEYLFKIVDETIQMIKKVEKDAEKAAKDKGTVRKPKVQFVVMVVDTIAGTSSKEEMTQDWGKDDYNRQAKQYHSGFRTMKNDLSRFNVAMLCTNQASEDLKTVDPHSKKYQAPDAGLRAFGGKALKFYATHRIFMRPMDTKYTLVKGAQFAAGTLIEFYSSKNRIRKPKRSGRMVLLFDEEEGGLHDILSILETLIFLKFAEYNEEGEIVFKFDSNDIEMKTFTLSTALDEDDDEDEEAEPAPKSRRSPAKPAVKSRRIRNPKISDRSEWLPFYRAHKEDLDVMYEKAITYVFTIEGLEPPAEALDIDSEVIPDNEAQEPVVQPKRRSQARRLPAPAAEEAEPVVQTEP